MLKSAIERRRARREARRREQEAAVWATLAKAPAPTFEPFDGAAFARSLERAAEACARLAREFRQVAARTAEAWRRLTQPAG